ncbi:alpha/beta-hydrolase [Westerdykella ornata]|uniref:Alpha/beta-hydrolase n=1 Tax=Westerdykella ornata TaxID=318751 RepID=A0A6A6JFR7_WESOR|nr:alpha/beta-hydrolase [Westerdykella ornata]KAF2275391.1 alpha/beta-hydrolase [Westerdykella ornata]
MLRRLLFLPRTAPHRRLFSAVASPRTEHVTIPCGSNGTVTVDIFHASRASQSAPVLIYLPSGPLLPEHTAEEDRLVKALAASSRSTLARINYRATTGITWPTPLHDVLAGYDWIIQHLLSDESQVARLGVCGELLGASLATSLALTECRLGGSRIVAAAANNPVADWVFADDLPVAEPSNLPEPRAPEETAIPADQDTMTWWAQQEDKDERETPAKPARPKKRASKPPSAWLTNADNPVIPTLTLSAQRDILFGNPQHMFDRFASPIHFFRSPHGELIYPKDDDGFASLDPLDIEDRLDINHYESRQDMERDRAPLMPVLRRCRAYARIYPPANMLLSLPQWHITTGLNSPLLDQASELAKMLKRSIARRQLRTKTARIMWQDPVEKAKYEAWADQRVGLSTSEGVGLWTVSDSPSWQDGVESLGRWMEECLTSKPA